MTTDGAGLVESRTRPLNHGMTALREELGSVQPHASLSSTCIAVIQALRQHGRTTSPSSPGPQSPVRTPGGGQI
jgi:hypothetical protein